jgi:hypothetical protein
MSETDTNLFLEDQVSRRYRLIDGEVDAPDQRAILARLAADQALPPMLSVGARSLVQFDGGAGEAQPEPI